jgi:hypothetical protein
LAEIAAEVLGTAATWVASTGSRAAGWERGADSALASGPAARGRPVFFWGARCAAWPVVKAPPPPKRLAQKAQADVLIYPHRLHYALPGWDGRRGGEARDAQDELHSAAQARAWADGEHFDADYGCAFDGVGRPARPRNSAARPRRRVPCIMPHVDYGGSTGRRLIGCFLQQGGGGGGVPPGSKCVWGVAHGTGSLWPPVFGRAQEPPLSSRCWSLLIGTGIIAVVRFGRAQSCRS